MMIEDMVGQGKSKEEIKVFLTDKVGINKDEAEKIVNEVLRSRRAGEDMKGLYA
jgi:nucleoid DNA-binding protein